MANRWTENCHKYKNKLYKFPVYKFQLEVLYSIQNKLTKILRKQEKGYYKCLIETNITNI